MFARLMLKRHLFDLLQTVVYNKQLDPIRCLVAIQLLAGSASSQLTQVDLYNDSEMLAVVTSIVAYQSRRARR